MIDALYEGTFSVGMDKQFNPIQRSEPAAKGALKISLNPFLIQTRERNILIDCGLGDYGVKSHLPILQDNLKRFGLIEEDISDVVCSHLHWDHIGGLAHQKHGEMALTFPEASIWLSGQEWKQVNERYDEENVKGDFLQFLDANADLHFLNDGDSPFDGVEVEVIGGHTEFSLVVWIDLPGVKFLMAGDVIGTKGAINRSYSAKYDFDGKRSQMQRTRLIKQCWEDVFGILCYHDNDMPLIRLTGFSEDNGYSFTSI